MRYKKRWDFGIGIIMAFIVAILESLFGGRKR